MKKIYPLIAAVLIAMPSASQAQSAQTVQRAAAKVKHLLMPNVAKAAAKATTEGGVWRPGKAVVYEYNNSAWSKQYDQTFTYNTAGYILTDEKSYDNGSATLTTNTYDSLLPSYLTLTTESSRSSATEAWSEPTVTLRREVTHDSEGRITSVTEYADEDSDSPTTLTVKYDNDGKACELSMSQYDSDAGNSTITMSNIKWQDYNYDGLFSFFSSDSEAFGFTAEDVKGICKDYGHSERYEEARQWYDGYRFGTVDVYNPWSILNYIDSGFEPKSYWAGTSGNDIIDNLMDDLSADVFDNLEKIIKGEEVSQVLSDTVVYEDILHGGDASDLFSVMAMSGYLRAVSTGKVDEYDLSIPNLEVSKVFKDMFVRRMGVSGKRVRDLEKSLITRDPDRVSDLLESFVMSIDPKVMSHEHAYEILCIGLLMHLEGPYEVSNEIHQGKGYCDILLKSNVRSYPHALIELKRWRENDPGIDVLADGGLKQIHDKAYTHRLEGTVLLYGIAFRGTDVAVKSETITL